jgi:hypothetical protein
MERDKIYFIGISVDVMGYGVLSLSDVVLDRLYCPQIRERFGKVRLIIVCGDVPYYYMEYIQTQLNVPLYYVRGNHSPAIEHTGGGPKVEPQGGVDLHCRAVNHGGLLLAGVEGSLRYNRGSFQYTQSEMWQNVARLVPALLFNRLIHGRYLDIFVSHAPPWGIHDQPDPTHQGVRAFRWLLKVFKPAYHFHGHIHLLRPDALRVTQFHRTLVINSYGFYETDLQLPIPAMNKKRD